MAKDTEKKDGLSSTILVLLLLLVMGMLALDAGRGVDPRYISIFTGLLAFGITGSLAVLALRYFSDNDGYRPELFDSSPVRLLANIPYSRTIAAIVLMVVFIAGAANQGSVIPIINPYDSTTLLTQETLSTHSQTGTILRGSIYPGFGEEITGYLITSILVFIQLALWKKFDNDAFDNIALFILSAIVASGIWAITFSTAHTLAYGANAPAYLSAAFFGFTTQLTNQLVGAPVSILAHVAHNALVISSFSIAIAIGSAALLFIPKRTIK